MEINKKTNFSDFQRHWASPKYCSIFKIPWLQSLCIKYHQMLGWRTINNQCENSPLWMGTPYPHNRRCLCADGAASRPLWDYEYWLLLRQAARPECMYVCMWLFELYTYLPLAEKPGLCAGYNCGQAGASGLDHAVRLRQLLLRR